MSCWVNFLVPSSFVLLFGETAVSPLASCGKNACIAIGFAVFLAHVILLPVDGCSINPTRSFGPAIVGIIRNCDGMSTKGLEEIGQKLGKGGQRCSKNESFAWWWGVMGERCNPLVFFGETTIQVSASKPCKCGLRTEVDAKHKGCFFCRVSSR